MKGYLHKKISGKFSEVSFKEFIEKSWKLLEGFSFEKFLEEYMMEFLKKTLGKYLNSLRKFLQNFH